MQFRWTAAVEQQCYIARNSNYNSSSKVWTFLLPFFCTYLLTKFEVAHMPHTPRLIGWRCELWYLSEVSNWCITTTSRLGQLCVFSKSNCANSKRHKEENDEYNDHEDGLKENTELRWERVHHRDRSICICLRPRAWATSVPVLDLPSGTVVQEFAAGFASTAHLDDVITKDLDSNLVICHPSTSYERIYWNICILTRRTLKSVLSGTKMSNDFNKNPQLAEEGLPALNPWYLEILRCVLKLGYPKIEKKQEYFDTFPGIMDFKFLTQSAYLSNPNCQGRWNCM